MKNDELMIGDWVLYKPLNKIVKVEHAFQIEDKCHLCEPIPLTSDILKANGFNRSGAYMSKWWNNCDVIHPDGSFDNHINISTCGKDEHSEYISIWIPHKGLGMPLHYVHQLQHALRLCGLNELADNFKI